jgi:hypothetical protein
MIPKLAYPTYDLKLPSTGKIVTVRPFIVKEEKLLLMAVESDDEEEIINATKQVVNNCIVSEGINVDKLAFFDLDYLFIALRAKSVGEAIDIKYTCKKTNAEGEVCNHKFDAKIDIANVRVIKDENAPLDINISNGTSLKMQYPTYRTMKLLQNDEEHNLTKKIQLIASCIDMVVEGASVHTRKDITQDEMIEFVENLTQQQFKKLEYFIDNLPSFVITAQAICEKCGFQHALEYDDFTSFFV